MKSEYQGKQLSNPVSTGDGGGHFESRVQASFVILMLMKVRMSFLWNLPIVKVALQQRFKDIHTDDILLVLKEGDKEKKLFGQIKRTIHITQNDKIFKEVIAAAWQDYNGYLFRKNIDCIALITGPLSKGDIQSTRNLLEWARSSESADSFFRKIDSKISSKEKRNKLEVFQSVLQIANNGKIRKDVIFDFLRHFYLLSYDFDIKTSIYESLMCGMIQQNGIDSPYDTWTRVINEVENFNQNAGEITFATLPRDLISRFQPTVSYKFPRNLIQQRDWPITYDINIIYFTLIGAYDEKNSKDKELIEKISGVVYGEWVKSLRVMLGWPNSPLEVKNNIWNLSDRIYLWKHVGKECLLDDIIKFKNIAIEVLSEISPIFKVKTEERYTYYGERYSYSETLRNGISEGIVILAKYTESQHVGASQIKQIIFSVMNEILSQRSLSFWGSIDSQLPMLSEAAPRVFLENIEKTIQSKEKPFEKLFLQEKDNFLGQTYTSGLLQSLEQLAWSHKFFTRVCCTFAQLAIGQKRECIQNILVEIFLPWIVNTSATLDEKMSAIHCLEEENFNVAWNVLLQMLPGKVMTSSGIPKPQYTPVAGNDKVTKKEYIETLNEYISELITMAKNHLDKLPELIYDIWKLPEPYFMEVIKVLRFHKEEIQAKQLQKDIWKALQKAFMLYHKHSNAYDNITEQQVKEIESCIELYQPINVIEQYSLLFIKDEIALYTLGAEIYEEHKRIEKERKDAVSEIFDEKGLAGVLQLAVKAEDSEAVGRCLSRIGNHKIDLEILPSKLFDPHSNIVNMTIAYIKNRYYDGKGTWINSLSVNCWNMEEKLSFLVALPFYYEVWPYVERWLGNQEEKYWIQGEAYSIGIEHYEYAIDKLIKYNRICTAIRFLYYIWKLHRIFDVERICNALLVLTEQSISVQEKIDGYIVSELIKHLQTVNSRIICINDLEEIEWQYAQIIESYKVYPVMLYKKISHDATYFCQLIRAIFRSDKDNNYKEVSEREKNIAANAWHILYYWNMVPGTQADNLFSWLKFEKWYKIVKEQCIHSGHLHAANHYIGGVLLYAPQDTSGLWICKDLAGFLNREDNEDIRHGFFEKVINSRGAYWVDLEGKEERGLASKYERQAEEVKKLGYRRFAATLEEIADFYITEVERRKDGLF